MAYFKYHSHNIYFEEIGMGTPLLFLHGNTASSVMFSEIKETYAKDYRVILIDFLGCGKSERIQTWAEDLWYDEAMQAICLLDEKGYQNVNIIGTSGGALAGINIALERPDLVNKIIADSFEGEKANPLITENLRIGREASKNDVGSKMFYEMMNGSDWESVIDADTKSVIAHAEHIINFFHKPINTLKAKILFTGSKEDPFFPEGFYENLFHDMIGKVEHGKQFLFEHGGHPAMISNQEEFILISKAFFSNQD
ncbi:alpha/beta fold hydrolase [Roseburia sp. 499]|uniref:alpha/beta fold hydrolase n=1 Tax=Roseburia sp. 499 TaxID=1261634 RepID=UPI0009521FF3|nr:alpha/beta hydrolase [Roseburia sp. 499]WVK69639.1 alpha/beta hydrolase [Roseburia sp. 499]